MPSQLRYTLTKTIVIGSIVLSILSFFSASSGHKDLYPLFSWKLFSQPSGWKYIAEEYRIYAKADTNSTYQRISIKEVDGFNKDQYLYTFNYFVNQTLSDTLSVGQFKMRLFHFVRYVSPGYGSYKIVKETYNPKEVFFNRSKYDTSTIITF